MANAEFPWFPFNVRDALTDALWQKMSAFARGCFIQLLCYQWENESLPEDPAELAELAGISDLDMRAYVALARLEDRPRPSARREVFVAYAWPLLEAALPAKRGKRRNPRLERERVKLRARRKSYAERGQKGGRKSSKGNKLVSRAEAKGKHRASSSLSSSSSSSSSSSEKNVRGPTEVFGWWNKIAKRYGFPELRAITERRSAHIRARLRETPGMCEEVEAELERSSGFLAGSSWFSFDWFTKSPDNLAKLLEGNYRRSAGPGVKTLRQRNILPTDEPTTITVYHKDGTEETTVVPDLKKR